MEKISNQEFEEGLRESGISYPLLKNIAEQSGDYDRCDKLGPYQDDPIKEGRFIVYELDYGLGMVRESSFDKATGKNIKEKLREHDFCHALGSHQPDIRNTNNYIIHEIDYDFSVLREVTFDKESGEIKRLRYWDYKETFPKEVKN